MTKKKQEFEVTFYDDNPCRWGALTIKATSLAEAKRIAERMVKDPDEPLAFDYDGDKACLQDLYDTGSENEYDACSTTYYCVDDDWHYNPEWELGSKLVHWLIHNHSRIGEDVSGSDFIDMVASMIDDCDFDEHTLAKMGLNPKYMLACSQCGVMAQAGDMVAWEHELMHVECLDKLERDEEA